MCSRFCRALFSFTLGLILLAGLALAVESMAYSPERTAESPDRDAARVSGAAAPASPTAMPTLTLGIVPSDHFPALGSTLRYSITLRNTGDAAANAASMSNTLPIGLKFVTGTLATTGGAAIYDPISRTIYWGGDLAAGGRHTVTYAAVLNTADYIYNSATISHPLAAWPAGAVSSPADYWGDAEVLDSVHTFANTLGGYRHIAVDAAGVPHIAYGGNDLFYATPTTGSLQTAEAGAAGWRIETASAANASQAALVLDDQGRALIAYASGTSLWLARQASAAAGSAWTTERIVQYTSWTLQNKLDLRRGADGRLHLAYNRNDELYYTVHDGTAWSPPAVAIPKAACDLTSWGAGFSLAVDAANVAHVACIQRGSAPYEVRVYTGTTTAPWPTYQVITSSATTRYAYPSLTYDAATPHLAFVAGNRDLYHATTGSGWQLTRVDQPPNTAYALSAALDVAGGQIAVAYSYYESSATAYTNTIRLARRPWAGGAWSAETIEAFTYARTSANYAYPTLALDAAGRPHLAYYHAPEPSLRYAAQAGVGGAVKGGIASHKPLAMTTFTFQTVDESRELGASAVAVGSDASVHVAYLSGGVRYLLRPPGTREWTRTLAVPGVDDSYESELDLALDAANSPHIVYTKQGGPLYHADLHPDLRGLADLEGLVGTWLTRTVDMPGNLMAHPSIGAEAAGTAHIAYLAAAGGAEVLRHAALAGSTWQTATLATVGPAASDQYPQLVAQAGKVYILHFDCTAHQATGDYPIHLMLRTLAGSAWTTRDLYQWNGRCTESSGSQLLGSETGRLTAMLYALIEGGRVMLIGDFVIEPGGVTATVETVAAPEATGPMEIRAVWNENAHVPGTSQVPGTSEVTFADRAALAVGEAQVGRAPDLMTPLGGGWWYTTSPRQNRGSGIESVRLDSFGNKYVRYQGCAGSSGYIPVGTGLYGGQITPNNLARYGQTYAAVETDGSTIAVEAPSADCCLQTAVMPPKAAEEGCTTSPGSAYARCNTPVQVTAAAKEDQGWRFTEWTGAASGSAATTQALVTGKYPACSVATAHFLKQVAIAAKTAAPVFYPDVVAPEETISYLVALSWESSDGQPARNNRMNDAIPAYTDYVPGSVWASKGQAIYQGGPDDGVVQWPVGDVEIESGETVLIGFQVRLDTSELPLSRLDWPAQIVNTAAGYINGTHGYQKSTATFVFNPIVNATADTVAGDPHDGKCSQDGAPCSLREALAEVNYHPNRALPDGTVLRDVVSFNLANVPGTSEVPGTSAIAAIPIIPIRSALPAVTDPAIIDGNCQPGYIGFNRVQLDGSAGAYDGLRISAGGSTVRGLVITNFGPLGQPGVGHGIVIEIGDGNVISDSLIGATGAEDVLGNRGDGIRILGSAGNLLRQNLIGHNVGSGVVISGTAARGNRLEGNQIGVREAGGVLTWLGNLGNGVVIQEAPENTVGGADLAARNVVAGNLKTGLVIAGRGARANVVAGNIIGELRPNWEGGVRIVDGSDNRIGGTTAGERNVISYNGSTDTVGHGVVISGSQATRNAVLGNYIGVDSEGIHAMGNQGDGVLIAGAAYSNTIGGVTQSSRNVISGNRGNGIALTSGARGNTVAANYIGIDAVGGHGPDGEWFYIPNYEDGILVADAPANLIGQPVALAQNVISGNRGDGVEIRGAASAGTVLQWNFIGLIPDALGLRMNEGYGVFINGVPRNRIGGTTTLEGNHIAGNRAGVVVMGATATENVVIGNCIGLGAVGCFAPMGTQTQGVYIKDAPANRIGGAGQGERNVIAAAQTGMEIRGAGATGNVVEGNFIGVESEGREARLIGVDGVRIQDAANNTIGGIGAGRGNLISGSTNHGVVITGTGATGNRLLGNLIGTNADGSRAIGNEDGVHIGGAASGNQVGGAEAGAGNVIAFNRSNGVVVGSGSRNAILGNRIFANTLLGIDLAPAGLTPNDPGDGDTGPNGLQNFPLLASTVISGNTTISATLNSRPGATYRVEFFANPRYSALQGEQFLGSLDVTTDGNGNAAFERTFTGAERVIAMTATDRDGNTSEFSASPLVVNTTGDEEDANADDGQCDVDLAQPGSQCTLRAAIEEANRRKGADTIRFDIDTSFVPTIRPESDLPDIEGRVVIDGTSQRNEHRVQIDGSQAGEAANGLNITADHVVLSGLIISSFQGNGIRAENPTQLDLDHLEIRDNYRWGIRANKYTGLTIAHAEIANNGTEEQDYGGIFVGSGYLTGEELIVSENEGDGIRCNGKDGVNLENATIERNGEDGLEAWGWITLWGKIGIGANRGDGIYGMMGLVLREVESLDVIGNGEWGIELTGSMEGTKESAGVAVRVNANGGLPGEGGGIRIREGNLGTSEVTRFEVSENSGPGIDIAACDVLSLDDPTIHKNTGDGVHARCDKVELFDHVVVTDNDGDGIFAGKNLLLRSDDLVVTGNGGWGVYVGKDFDIHEEARGIPITINDNGRKMTSYDERGGIRLGISGSGGELWGKLAGSFQVCHNRGDGIRSLLGGGVSLAGASICDNQGWGIWLSGGRLSLGASQVTSNTLGAVWNGGRPGAQGVGEWNSPAEVERPPQRPGVAAEAASQLQTGDIQSLASDPSAITASQLRDNGGDGVRWEVAAGLSISGTNIAGNAGVGVNNVSSHVMLSGSTIQDQLRRITSEASRQPKMRPFAGDSPRSALADLPAQGDSGGGQALDARGNWWGAASGPGGAGPGTGDEVSAGVSFAPWLRSPVVLALAAAEDPLRASVSGAAAVNLLHLRSWLAVSDTVTITVADSRGWRVGPAVFTATLAPDLAAAVPITFAVAAGTPPGAASLATITATSRVSPTAVATATFQIVAATLADVALDKSAPREAAVGRPLTYTLVVSNRGPDPATGVVLTDTLPVSVTLISATPAQGTCSGATTVICNLGAIAPGAATSITLTTVPIASGAFWNTAAATAGELDPDPWNNADATTTNVWIELQQFYLPLVLRGATVR